jgi:hypothetical protein
MVRPSETTTTNNMKKDSKKETQSIGTLGGLFGQSITAVLRKLGREGVSTAHARAIMAAKGVKVSDTTVSIQVKSGKNKDKERGEPADLTAAQLKELLHAAPEPTAKETPAKEPKK